MYSWIVLYSGWKFWLRCGWLQDRLLADVIPEPPNCQEGRKRFNSFPLILTPLRIRLTTDFTCCIQYVWIPLRTGSNFILRIFWSLFCQQRVTIIQVNHKSVRSKENYASKKKTAKSLWFDVCRVFHMLASDLHSSRVHKALQSSPSPPTRNKYHLLFSVKLVFVLLDNDWSAIFQFHTFYILLFVWNCIMTVMTMDMGSAKQVNQQTAWMIAEPFRCIQWSALETE